MEDMSVKAAEGWQNQNVERNLVLMIQFKSMPEFKITPKDFSTALQSFLFWHKSVQVSFLSLSAEIDLKIWSIRNILSTVNFFHILSLFS